MEQKMFKAGNEWLKFIFHLHTKSDTSFKYSGNNFVKDFVDTLLKENIQLAAITNHNLFNFDEFNEINKEAQKQALCILPGLELSINDGKYGLHVLIIFNNNAIVDKDYVNEFLTLIFEGRNRFDEKGKPKPCTSNLKGTLEKLESFGKEHITIAAHVDNNKGFFTTFSPARIKEFITEDIFRTKLLAFQDINSSSRKTFESLLKEIFGKNIRPHVPAYVSFSDAKTLDDIGKRVSYIKIGDFEFSALKFPFLNHE